MTIRSSIDRVAQYTRGGVIKNRKTISVDPIQFSVVAKAIFSGSFGLASASLGGSDTGLGVQSVIGSRLERLYEKARQV